MFHVLPHPGAFIHSRYLKQIFTCDKDSRFCSSCRTDMTKICRVMAVTIYMIPHPVTAKRGIQRMGTVRKSPAVQCGCCINVFMRMRTRRSILLSKHSADTSPNRNSVLFLNNYPLFFHSFQRFLSPVPLKPCNGKGCQDVMDCPWTQQQ